MSVLCLYGCGTYTDEPDEVCIDCQRGIAPAARKIISNIRIPGTDNNSSVIPAKAGIQKDNLDRPIKSDDDKKNNGGAKMRQYGNGKCACGKEFRRTGARDTKCPECKAKPASQLKDIIEKPRKKTTTPVSDHPSLNKAGSQPDNLADVVTQIREMARAEVKKELMPLITELHIKLEVLEGKLQ